jgi:hypothetical protein
MAAPMRKAGSMANITNEHEALVRRILEGDGRAPHAQRRAVFDNAGLTGPLRTLTDKVAKHAYKVSPMGTSPRRGRQVSPKTRFSSSSCALPSARPRGSTKRRLRP